jgi:hypothetical protein
MKRVLTKKWVVGFSVLVGICFYSANSYAETAQVLPQGRSRFSFVYGQTDGVSEDFTDHGERESIVQPYEVQLSSATISKAKPEFATIVNGLNNLGCPEHCLHYDASKRNDPNHGVSTDANGPLLGDAFSRGYLSLDAQAHQQEYATSYQYGLTKHLTIGFMVPVKKMQVNAGASIDGLNQASDIVKQVGTPALQQINDAMQLVSTGNLQTIKDILKTQGYSDATSWSKSGVGDVVFGGRYNYVATPQDRFLSSFQMGVAAPTGAVKDPSQPLTQDFGTGAWYGELANIVNYNPAQWVTLSNGTHYGKYLANHRQMRTDPDAFLPDASTQEDVTVRQGDKYSTNFGVDFHVTQGLTFNTSYEFDWQKISNYQGSKNMDYSYLSMDSNTFQEVAQAGLSLTTIPSFLKAEFPVPMGVAVNFYVPTTGKNVPIVPYGTAELDLYF